MRMANVTYWSNDGTSVAGSEPQASVAVPVNGGLYAVLLGNTAQQGMGAIDPTVFAQHTDAKSGMVQRWDQWVSAIKS